MLWATCGGAVAVSAVAGVLIGVHVTAPAEDRPSGGGPAVTQVRSRTSTPPVTWSITPTSEPSPEAASPSARGTTRSTTQAAPPPPEEETQEPQLPPVVQQPTTQEPSPTTTTTRGWPCSPLNPLPPPSCTE
ncbi:hypothetical protein [Umezawaea beigongshangensis]|uniref:hypothetical protein n=1 Tax=Umezawaea beigongshangensis TaxID=2780383 RepID=UPI0018F178F9|nr:hypothetical protein [Umezawaea beigongshangensis]